MEKENYGKKNYGDCSMINLQKYKQILDSGLLLDHYQALLAIRDNTELPTSRRVKGFINLLEKKGYICEGILTEKAFEIMGLSTTTSTTTEVRSQKEIDFSVWIDKLHAKCQTRLIELTGTKQIRGKVNGKSYPFLPNSIDLGRVLVRVITAYKIQDYDKIEKVILRHIENCHQANSFFPLINYYIMKNNMSQMVTDMENPDDKIVERIPHKLE